MEDSLTRNMVGGVMARDELPLEPKPQNKQIFIVNTQPASQCGAHWLAIYLPTNKNQPVEFFDVLGNPPTAYHKEIVQFLETNGPNYMYQTYRLQSQEAMTCGHFCLYYFLHRVRGVPLDNIVQDFHPHCYRVNEQKVEDFIKTHFNVV